MGKDMQSDSGAKDAKDTDLMKDLSDEQSEDLQKTMSEADKQDAA